MLGRVPAEVALAEALARISHQPPDSVAHAHMRAVSRLVSIPRPALSRTKRRQSGDAARTSACATVPPTNAGEKCGLAGASTAG
jgi:hypothetical protein